MIFSFQVQGLCFNPLPAPEYREIALAGGCPSMIVGFNPLPAPEYREIHVWFLKIHRRMCFNPLPAPEYREIEPDIFR